MSKGCGHDKGCCPWSATREGMAISRVPFCNPWQSGNPGESLEIPKIRGNPWESLGILGNCCTVESGGIDGDSCLRSVRRGE